MTEYLSRGIAVLRDEGLRRFIGKSGKFLCSKIFNPVGYQVRSHLPVLYYTSAKWWYRNRKQFDTDDWDAPLDPYKVIWVSPDNITKMTSRPPNLPIEERIEKFGAVEGGDWDISSDMQYRSWRPETYGDNKWIYEHLIDREFEQTTFFRSAKQHFHNGVPWEETSFYEQIVDGFNKAYAGLPAYGSNKAEFEESLYTIDRLYRNVKKNGVLMESEINNKPFDYTLNDSILVDIARDGELLFVEGRRRLTVAKLLAVDQIPIRIQIRHSDWMEYRDTVFNNKVEVKHPDFFEFQ